MKRLALSIAVLIPALALAPPAPASGLRCNQDWVEVGDSAAELLQMCGEPMTRRTLASENPAKTEGSAEQWTYSFGPANFLQIVTIQAGKVRVIEDVEQQ